MSITLFGVPAHAASEAPARLSCVLWGPPGGGKTTLALTAPGRKLVAAFDPGGMDSVRNAPDVVFADLSISDKRVIETWNSEDPLGIASHIAEFDTIIIDSLTRYSELALHYAVSRAKNATLDVPTQQAYGMRNTYVLTFISRLVAQIGKLNKNLILISHEGSPDKDEKGNVLSVRMMLGGQLPNLTAKDFNEVWFVDDNGKERRISIRPERMRSPMKTRMFDGAGKASFEWKFDPTTWSGEGIADWFAKWQANGMQKIPLPK